MINTEILRTLAVSEVQAAASRVGSSWTWYIIRAAGFVAALLLFLLIASGIGQVTGLTYRFIAPVKAWLIHKSMGIALLVAIAIHVSFLLIDKYLPFSLPQILVPFLSHYSNKSTVLSVGLGSIAIGLGVLAMYGLIVIVASSLGWITTRKRLWHNLHYVSYFVLFAVFVHALGAGSDLKYGEFRAAWIAVGLVAAGVVAYRLRRAGSLKQ